MNCPPAFDWYGQGVPIAVTIVLILVAVIILGMGGSLVAMLMADAFERWKKVLND